MDYSKVFAQSKEYETIAEKHEVLHEKIEKALTIVREFIVKKKLIIYGGMSIDLSLKLAGDKGIYSEDVTPDYDFMSPNMYEDSIELADVLHKAGLPQISAINAYHITTRRVRVQFRVVADITYVPKNIFDKLPTLKYKDILIIHPLFQRLDFHMAFAFPFNNAPNEVIFGRSSKDQTRFRLLDAKYSIRPDPKSMNLLKKEFSEADLSRVQFHVPKDCVIGGVVVYAFLYDLMGKLLGNGSDLVPILKESATLVLLEEEYKKLVPTSLEISQDMFLVVFPKSINPILTFVTDHPMDIFPSVGSSFYSPSGMKRKKEPEVKVIGEQFYNRFLEIKSRFRRVIIQQNETTNITIDLLDNYGALFPVFKISEIANELHKYSTSWSLATNSWLIANIQHTLAQLLLPHFSNNTMSTNLYWSLMRLVWMAEQIVNVLPIDKKPTFLKFMPYFLTAQTYGSRNWDQTYVAIKQEQVGHSPRPPRGYYPDKGKEPEKFSYAESWAFKTDGEKADSLPEIKF
jgi:hypothetical protein